MKVCIAEKPSVAKDIARILGANSAHTGYMEGNGYQVTWTFGHLCELKEPHDYTLNWKHWSLGSLPMIPSRFGIKLIEDEGIKRQFDIIKKLFQAADEIINCGDAGQEGELIQRWVMQKAGAKCPVRRLWISSMTDEAIREGFANLRDEAQYKPLYLAGLSRAIGDWLLGMNATRLYTLKYGRNSYGKGQILSIGRVQTPTLSLIGYSQPSIETHNLRLQRGSLHLKKRAKRLSQPLKENLLLSPMSLKRRVQNNPNNSMISRHCRWIVIENMVIRLK